MPYGPIMEVYALQLHATGIFFLDPIHDGNHFTALRSGTREELHEGQVVLLGDKT